MQKYNSESEKKIVREGLHNGIMTVHFTKKNGDTRVMSCTLKPEIIPVEFHPKVKEEQANDQSDNVEMEKTEGKEDKICAVYDINAKGWRSFAWERVKDVQYGIPSLDF